MYKKSAKQLSDAFKNGDITAVEIADYFLKRISKYNPQVNAFLRTHDDDVYAKAEALDRKRKNNEPLGKLAAVPIAIKDNIHMRGKITSCGSKFLENYEAPFDSTVCRLIEQEDAFLIGKTNLDEFAMGSSTEYSAFGLTRNPWNLDCSPGGSSGGSAVAVAAGLAPLSLGSDTGGSVRQPASLTGIVGYKPTYGRVSRYGLVAFGSSLDQIGPFARNVEDAALMLEVIAHPCQDDATTTQIGSEPYCDELSSSIQGKTIGIPRASLEGLDPEVNESFEAAIDLYRSMGMKVVDIDLELMKHAISVYYILAPAEASTNLARFDGVQFSKRSDKATTLEEMYAYSKQEGYGNEVKQRILLGTYVLSSGYQDAYYRKAQKVRTLIIESFKQAFNACDIIATPTSPSTAFTLGSIQDPMTMYLQDVYTASANLAGLPAISIPCGFSREEKPIGLQLMGWQLEDAKVLRFAHQFERELGLYDAFPKAFADGELT